MIYQYTPQKIKMAMNHPPFVDVHPIENEGFSIQPC